MFSIIFFKAPPSGGWIDDNGVTSWIDDNGVTTAIDDNGVNS